MFQKLGFFKALGKYYLILFCLISQTSVTKLLTRSGFLMSLIFTWYVLIMSKPKKLIDKIYMNFMNGVQYQYCHLGRVPKKMWKSIVFCQTPFGPPPRFGHFSDEKIDPQFFLEIRPILGETNFTLGPISKSILFCFYNGFYNCHFPPGFGAFGLLSKLS